MNKNRLLTTLAVVYCAAKLGLLCVYAVHTQYVMDEYWQGGESLYHREFYGTYDPVKTVLYTYFYGIARLLTTTSTELMRVARLQTLLLFGAMLALLWKTWRALDLEREEALFALCVLLSFSNIMERSIRVRSDHVALFFDVAAVAVVCRGNLTSRWRAFAGGALIGMAFLSTQKAAFAAVAMGVALSITLWSTSGFRRAVITGGSCLVGFLAALGAYALYFSDRGFDSIMKPTMTRPMDLVMNATQYYPNLRDYLWQTLSRNWLSYLLTFAGLAIAAAGWKRATPAQRFATIFTAVFAAFIFTHNQPWPYLFVSVIVFLAPWSAEVLRILRRVAGERAPIVAIALLLCLSWSFARNFFYLGKDNAVQEAVSDQAERLLGPSDRYEDGTGMITTRRLAGHMWWDAMAFARLQADASRRDFSGFAPMVAGQPKLFILNYRVLALLPILRTFVEHSYIAVHRNILMSGVRLADSERLFVNRWTGPYAVYGSRGKVNGARIVINGAETTTPVKLAVGGVYKVQLVAPSAEPLFLLPADLPLESVVPVTAPPMELYEGVYE